MPRAAARSATAACSTAEGVQFGVEDTQKIKADVFGHHGTQTQGTLKVGDTVKAAVDMARARTPPCATTASRT